MDVLSALSKLYDRFGREYTPFERIFSEGETGNDMYVVIGGSVEVLRTPVEAGGKDAVVLARPGVGDFFGEMSMLLDELRSATVRAGAEGAKVVRFSPGNFDLIVKLQPQVAVQMLKTLAQRLRATSLRIAK
jgi:CRP/FNR family transcriptional regulator, cyclic AMP receptor protein